MLFAEDFVQYIPHFVQEENVWQTQISLTNPSAENMSITIQSYSSDGLAAESNIIQLNAFASFHGSIDELIPAMSISNGSLSLNSSPNKVNGIVRFVYIPNGGTTTLILNNQTSLYSIMPRLESQGIWSSGFAIFNPNDVSSNISLYLLNPEGNVLETHQVQLQAHEKLVSMLGDIFTGDLPDVTSLMVKSDQEICGFALSFGNNIQQIVAVSLEPIDPVDILEEDKILSSTFRIDIKSIDAVLDFSPDQQKVNGVASLDFSMRPGQQKPLFHFGLSSFTDQAGKIYNHQILSATLDGQSLDINTELLQILISGSAQNVWEIQRTINDNLVHTLEITYEFIAKQGHDWVFSGTPSSGWLYSDVNDIIGEGNEIFWPTINSPEELIDHHITLRVNSDATYKCIGSGLVTSSPNKKDIQEWELSFNQAISSYTLMFILAPDADVKTVDTVVDGNNIHLMTFNTGPNLNSAVSVLEGWLPQLRQDLGPFPMPDGFSGFITAGGGGMEYYGGSITSISALEHEVFHMYFACSVVAKTFRDSWFDEAITMWYGRIASATNSTIADDFQSGMVSNRDIIQPGFDTRAYSFGARMFENLKIKLGGNDELISVLSQIHQKHLFFPFSSMDMVDYFHRYGQLDIESLFMSWLFSGGKKQTDPQMLYWHNYYHKVEMHP